MSLQGPSFFRGAKSTVPDDGRMYFSMSMGFLKESFSKRLPAASSQELEARSYFPLSIPFQKNFSYPLANKTRIEYDKNVG